MPRAKPNHLLNLGIGKVSLVFVEVKLPIEQLVISLSASWCQAPKGCWLGSQSFLVSWDLGGWGSLQEQVIPRGRWVVIGPRTVMSRDQEGQPHLNQRKETLLSEKEGKYVGQGAIDTCCRTKWKWFFTLNNYEYSIETLSWPPSQQIEFSPLTMR